MKNNILFSLAFLFCTNVYAQVEYPLLHNQVKIELLRLVNPVNPGVEICYERIYLKGFLSTQISGTALYTIKNTYDNQSGFRIGLQQKWFFRNNTDYQLPIRPYLALIYEYQNSKFDATANFVDTTLAEPNYSEPENFDSFNGTKIFHTFNIAFGAQFVKNHFMFELTGGIGGKSKVINLYNIDYPTFEMYNGRHGFIHNNSLKEGKSSFVNFIIQLKIGYYF